jgi:DNA-binding NtrC family response regulator
MSSQEPIRILIADDEVGFLKALATYLSKPWREILTARNGAEAVSVLESSKVDVVITDLVMPRVDGLGVLQKVVQSGSRSLVILMTGYGSIETAVRAMSQGAFDYKTKPFLLEEMGLAVARAEAHLRLLREKEALRMERDSLLKELEQLRNLVMSRDAPEVAQPKRSPNLNVLEKTPNLQTAFSWYKRWRPENSMEEELELLRELREQGLLTQEQWMKLQRRIESTSG